MARLILSVFAITTRVAAFATLAALIGIRPDTADAQAFRAYLSIKGIDGNQSAPNFCNLANPCRTLPAALNAVANNGEIWMLDSANYNTATVNITKSVTILAVPGALGSIAANGADAISINAAGVNVTLRNINVVNLSGASNTGVVFQQGATLTVENCEFYGLNGGIYQEAGGSTTLIKDSVIRNAYFGFLALPATIGATLDATLDGVRITNGQVGAVVASDSRVTVTNSVFANNALALNDIGGVLVVAHSTISGTAVATGISVYADPSAISEVFAEANVIHVGYGFTFIAGGGTEKIYSTGDNKLVYYIAPVAGGSLSPLSPW